MHDAIVSAVVVYVEMPVVGGGEVGEVAAGCARV